MDGSMSRRRLLAGLGVGTGAAALGVARGSAWPASSVPPGVQTAAALPAQPFTYITVSPASFIHPDRVLSATGATLSSVPGTLVAALDLPLNARLGGVQIYWTAMRGVMPAELVRYEAGASAQNVGAATLPSTSTEQFIPADQLVSAGRSFVLEVELNDPSQAIQGALLAFTAPTPPSPGSSSLVLLPTPFRVYDSRLPGVGKFTAGEIRKIALVGSGVPAGVAAVLLNVTVAETGPLGGFAAVWRADVAAWPGSSTVNWTGADQQVANFAVSAVNPSAEVNCLVAVSAAHVIIDVIGSFA